MPSEVASGELATGRVAVDWAGLAEPVPDQHECLLCTGHRPPDDEPPQGGEQQYVDQRLACGGHAGTRTTSRNLPRTSGPSVANARSIAAMPFSAASVLTPSCRSRRALAVRCAGAVSACSQG